jgi:NAD-dependent deacetylase
MQKIEQIAEWLAAGSGAVVFSGAGMSTESGIPDFRSPGGVWATNQPVYFDEYMASSEARYEYWRQKSIAHQDFADSQPNCGHKLLAAWEQIGMVQGVITQNIDGLHQLAGSSLVLELHGTARQVACLECGARGPADQAVAEFLVMDEVPSCPECDGITKHATISFGQQLDDEVLRQADQLVQRADLLLVMGSSLVVQPAASLPAIAARSGARVVIINRDATDQDGIADAVIHGEIGETLEAINSCLENS